MSQSRCGLQVSRDITISKDFHNHPRKKQLGCLINGSIKRPGESMITTDLAEDELDNQRVIAKREKMDLAELSLTKIAKGVEALLPTEKKIEEIKKEEMKGEEQKGEGFKSDLLKKLINVLPVRKIGESLAASISNIFPDSDENARKIFPGEHHAIVKLPNGKFGRANYTGPGTRIVERLAREPGGDPPRVLSDKVSQAHDIRYGLGKTEDDIRKADLKMLSSLSDLKRDKLDRNSNIVPAMIGIRGKVVAENFSLLSRSQFIDPNFNPSPSGIQLMKDKLQELEQQGFGFRDKPFKSRRPGQFSREVIQALQTAPVPRARVPFTSTIGKRNQVPQPSLLTREGTIIQSVPQKKGFQKGVAKFGGPTFLDPQPGTSSTQSLAKIYGEDGRRGVALDRRGNQSSFSDRLKQQFNTRAEFRDRRSGVSQTGSGRSARKAELTGGYQVPGMASSSGHQMIDIKTSPSLLVKSGSGGQAGVNPIAVQTGSGLPGTALLKKLSKKVQKSKQFQKGKMRTNMKPLFMDDHEMSRIMANQLLPMISAR